MHQLSASLAVWHRYDPTVKADLYSTRLMATSGTYLVDPIQLDSAAFQVLLEGDHVAGLIVTNGNHARAALEFSQELSAPIYAHAAARTDLQGADVIELTDGLSIASDLTALTIEGAGPGEIALHSAGEGGTLVVGDALINMGSAGFSFLPPKYCTKPKLMRKSLRKLLDYSFERILFAHGAPIVSQARPRLVELLNGGA